MKRIYVCMLIIFVMIALLSACTENGVPSMVEQRYVAYLEATKTDYATAVNEYTHFEHIDLKLLTAESKLYTTAYEIVGWEQLSGKLWVVKCNLTNSPHSEGLEVNHFVGLIDGQYFVMLNTDEIPEELKSNLDLKEYERTGEEYVDPEDVIK